MLKKIIRIIFGVILAGLMAFLVIFIYQNNKKTAENSGTITVLVNSKDNEILDKRRISYDSGDTLYEIISKEYVLTCSDTSYGHYMTGIEGNGFSVKTDGKSSWCYFELFYLKDGKEYSDSIDFADYEEQSVTTGIDGISLHDDMIFAINEQDAAHASSVLVSTMPKDSSSNVNVFEIVVFSLMGVMIFGLVIYFIATRKDNKISVRELAIMAFMTVILFVQEELLSFLPNIQLTFLLMAVYVKVFGYKKTTLIVLVHVILDNLLMGSLVPTVFLPMLSGYMIYITILNLVKDKNMAFIVLSGILGSLIYCYMFLAVNVLILEIDMWAYFIADVPFEALLCLSTTVTLLYLYKPLSRKLSELYDPNEYMKMNDGEIM